MQKLKPKIKKENKAQTVDYPEQIKFFEAFRTRQSQKKLPIKPVGSYFKDDVDKLKQCTEVLHQTLLKVEQERAIKSEREKSQINELVNDFKNYQNQKLLNPQAISKYQKRIINRSFNPKDDEILKQIAFISNIVVEKATDRQKSENQDSKINKKRNSTIIKSKQFVLNNKIEEFQNNQVIDQNRNNTQLQVQMKAQLNQFLGKIDGNQKRKNNKSFQDQKSKDFQSNIAQYNKIEIPNDINQRQILFQDNVKNTKNLEQDNINSIQQMKIQLSPNRKIDLEPNKIIVTQIESSQSLQNNIQPPKQNNHYGSFMDLDVNQNNLQGIANNNIGVFFDQIQDSSKYLQNNQIIEKLDPSCKSQDDLEKIKIDDDGQNKKISDVFFGSIYQITNLDLNKNGSLAKIATAGYARGNWKGQQSQTIKYQKLKSISPIKNNQANSPNYKTKNLTPSNCNNNLNYYRYPNLGENAHSRQYSMFDNQIYDQVKSENENLQNAEVKSGSKVQSIMNRPLLQSKANYSIVLQKNAIENLLKTQMDQQNDNQLDNIQRFRYSNKRDYNIQQPDDTHKSRKPSFTLSAEKDFKTYVQGRSIQSQSRQSSDQNSNVVSNKSIKNQTYINLKEDNESMNIRAVEQIIKSQNLLPINNLDVASRADIQNALQLEREQTQIFSQAKSDKKLINFKGQIRNTMQENLNQEKQNLQDEKTVLTSAVYSRLRIQSGQVHKKHLRQVKRRKEFQNLQMEDIKNVKQMTKLQIQFIKPTAQNNNMNLKQQLQEIQCAIMKKKPNIQQISSRNINRQKSTNKNGQPSQKQMQIQFNGRDMTQSQQHIVEMINPKTQKLFQVNNIFEVNRSIVSTGRFTLQASQKFENGQFKNKTTEQIRLSSSNTLVSKNLHSNQQNKSYIFEQSSNNRFQAENQASFSQKKQSENHDAYTNQRSNVSVEKHSKFESGLKKMNPSIRSIHSNNSEDKDGGQGSKFEAKSIYAHKNILQQQALLMSGSKESFQENSFQAKQNLTQTSNEKQGAGKLLQRAKTLSTQNNKLSVFSSHKKNGPSNQNSTLQNQNGTIQEEEEPNRISLMKQKTQLEQQDRGNLLGSQFQDEVTLSNRQYRNIENTDSIQKEKKEVGPVFNQNIYLVIEEQKNKRNTEMLLMDNAQIPSEKKDSPCKQKKFEQNISNIMDEINSDSNLTPAQKLTQKLKPSFEQASQNNKNQFKFVQSPQSRDQNQFNASTQQSNQKNKFNQDMNLEIDKKNDGQFSIYSKTLSQNTCRIGLNSRDLARTNLGFAEEKNKFINFQNQNEIKIVCGQNLPKDLEKILKNAPIIPQNLQRTQENFSMTIENSNQQNYRRTASYNLKNGQQKKTLHYQSLGRTQTANINKQNYNIQKMLQNNKGLKTLFSDIEVVNNQENSYQLYQNEILNQINNQQKNYALSFQSTLSVTSQEKIKRNIKSSQDAFAKNTNIKQVNFHLKNCFCSVKQERRFKNQNQDAIQNQQEDQNDHTQRAMVAQKTGVIDRQFSDFIKESLVNARSYLFSQGGNIQSQNNKMDSSKSYEQQYQKGKKVRLSSATTVDIRKSQQNTNQYPISSVLDSVTIPWSNASGANANLLHFGEQKNTIFATGRSTMHMTNFKKNDFKKEERFQKDSEHDSNMVGVGVIQSALNTNINVTQMSTKRQQSAKGQIRKPPNMNHSTFQQYLQKINENSKSIQSIDFKNINKHEIKQNTQIVQVDQSFRHDEFGIQNLQNPFKQLSNSELLKSGNKAEQGQQYLKQFMDDGFKDQIQRNHQVSVNQPRIINDVLSKKQMDEENDLEDCKVNQSLTQQSNLFKSRDRIFSGKQQQNANNYK